jgi:cullin-4
MIQEIQKATLIAAHDLTRVLQSLALGKARVLSKDPMTKEVSPSDRFSFNDKFTSKLHRVKIPQLVVREAAPEREVRYKLCMLSSLN